jgi:hypothetical protein
MIPSPRWARPHATSAAATKHFVPDLIPPPPPCATRIQGEESRGGAERSRTYDFSGYGGWALIATLFENGEMTRPGFFCPPKCMAGRSHEILLGHCPRGLDGILPKPVCPAVRPSDQAVSEGGSLVRGREPGEFFVRRLRLHRNFRRGRWRIPA